MTHMKRQKINFSNSGAVNIIRNAYYIHVPELIKLISTHLTEITLA